MNKLIGIASLLLVVSAVTAFMEPNFLQPFNVSNNLRWVGMYGIMGVGVAFVIITGGIDLSIGSVVALVGCLLPMFILEGDDGFGMSPWVGVPLVLLIALGLGLLHGLLITKLKLQPFVVTLCGLLLYRGIARYITGDSTQGFGQGFKTLKGLAAGSPFEAPIPGIGWVEIPAPFLVLMAITVVGAVFLNMTIYGRFLLALGRNEEAARMSGINTDRMILVAYAISGLAAGLAGVIFALDLNSVQPSSHGNFFELYAIAAAVLGGCSLRGGEGLIFGVVLGTAVIRVLNNAINVLGIPSNLEFAVIGGVILVGVIADELVKRLATARRAAREATDAGGEP